MFGTSSSPPQVVGVFQRSPLRGDPTAPADDVRNLGAGSIALRQVAGKWYQINISTSGLWGDVGETHGEDVIYYTAANCTGPQVMLLDVFLDARGEPGPTPVVQTAMWDGAALWAANAQAATVVPALYSKGGPGTCSQLPIPADFANLIEYVVGPATQIESPRFIGPLTVK